MKCYIPTNSGFCFGVSLAVNTAYKNANNTTYMYGEIVHNPMVISDLLDKGIHLVNSINEIPNSSNTTVIIRAHGVSEQLIKEFKKRKIEIIDNTCPNVKKVHDIVNDASNRGLEILLVGNPNHPEVIGTIGWAKTKTFILPNLETTREIIPDIVSSPKGVCMVAQTTYNKEKYEEIYKYCSSIINKIEYNETICSATADRQNEIKNLSKIADHIIIIGGKKSSNVNKLYEIASEYCRNVQYIECASELNVSELYSVSNLVVSSGASTPESVVKEVVKKIEHYCFENDITLEVDTNFNNY